MIFDLNCVQATKDKHTDVIKKKKGPNVCSNICKLPRKHLRSFPAQLFWCNICNGTLCIELRVTKTEEKHNSVVLLSNEDGHISSMSKQRIVSAMLTIYLLVQTKR